MEGDLMRLIEGLKSLVDDMALYMDQLEHLQGELRISVKLTDTGEEATIVVGDGIRVEEGAGDLDMRINMEEATFDRVLKGEADFGALIGRSRMSDVRPINPEFLNPERVSATFEALKVMMNVFFTPSRHKVKELRSELAGDAHGAHPIPLVYWDGLRFAWYLIRRGEVLNEAGERDPYPQVVIPLKGSGTIVLDGDENELRPNTAVYIPANSLHQIRAEEDVEALWLAWKAPP
jgi:mannose-6-phosphate isomerase-like protein (cupin superfamily)